MNNLLRRASGHVAVVTALISVARAHPGHDGHEGGGEFTWDFSHLVSHPLATVAGIALMGWFAVVLLNRLDVRREVQTFRKSSDNR
jgi:hydrogenase/urease accessory protein HupE